jgi:hypothetical protein
LGQVGTIDNTSTMAAGRARLWMRPPSAASRSRRAANIRMKLGMLRTSRVQNPMMRAQVLQNID